MKQSGAVISGIWIKLMELLQEMQRSAVRQNNSEEAWLDAITIYEAFDFGRKEKNSPFCLLTSLR